MMLCLAKIPSPAPLVAHIPLVHLISVFLLRIKQEFKMKQKNLQKK